MAKTFHVKHARRGRRVAGKLPRAFRLKCYTCKVENPREVLCCFIDDWQESPSQKLLYCPEHAGRAGFCVSCGRFWAGIDRFDFGPGKHLCDHCWDQVRADTDGWAGEDSPDCDDFEDFDYEAAEDLGLSDEFWDDFRKARKHSQESSQEISGP